jgi:hypothetical protein
MKKVYIYILLGAILFFLGRQTAPIETTQDTQKLDSLRKDIQQRERRERQLMDSVTHYRILSDTWFNLAQSHLKEKQALWLKYNNEVSHIDNLTDAQLDSAFRAKYPDK